MFEHFTTPAEIFHYKLGSALSMEHDSLEMLGDMEKIAMRSDLKELFREHADETRQQIQNLEQCFALLGETVHQTPSPATKGMAREFKSSTGKTDRSLVDGVVLAGALETEHYETAVYETLINYAKARGTMDIVKLLSQNLEQESAAIEKIKAAADSVTHADAETQDDAQAQDNTAAREPEIDVPPYLPPTFI